MLSYKKIPAGMVKQANDGIIKKIKAKRAARSNRLFSLFWLLLQ